MRKTQYKSQEAETARAIEKYLAPPDVHEVQRERSGGLVTLLAAIILFPIELFLFYGIITRSISPTLGFLVHALIVAILAAFAYLLSRGSEGKFTTLLLMAVMTSGPFGAAGVILTIAIYFWGMRHALAFEEWYDSIFPKQQKTVSQYVYENIIIGRDEASQSYSVISFMDVMSFGSEEQKRQALSKATSNFHPSFAPVFRKALNDSSNTIRVLAATGVSRIESNFLKRMMQLTELQATHKKDRLVIWALAEHYDNYAFTGLLDFDRELNNRQKALECYTEYLKIRPKDLEPRNRIGRILMRNKEYAKACEWFEKCIKEGYVSDSISQWYSEALFECGRYGDLRRYRGGLPVNTRDANASGPVNEALALWSGSRV